MDEDGEDFIVSHDPGKYSNHKMEDYGNDYKDYNHDSEDYSSKIKDHNHRIEDYNQKDVEDYNWDVVEHMNKSSSNNNKSSKGYNKSSSDYNKSSSDYNKYSSDYNKRSLEYNGTEHDIGVNGFKCDSDYGKCDGDSDYGKLALDYNGVVENGLDCEQYSDVDREHVELEGRTSPEGELPLAQQLAQVEEMVGEMKSAFTTAMSALSDIQNGDKILHEAVQANKDEQEKHLSDVVEMVLSLKTEFEGVMGQLKVATESQQTLYKQIELLQIERDILLDELEKTGTISSNIRDRYHSGKDRPSGLNRTSSSTTLSALLERARSAFNQSQNNSHVTTSDHDSGVNTYHNGEISSCDDVTSPHVFTTSPPALSPIVHSYIAGLSHQHSANEDIPVEEPHYDSDSSLTQAANKSLDLSKSLGDVCGDPTQPESSDDEDETKSQSRQQNNTPPKAQSIPNEKYSHSPAFKVPHTPQPRVPPHERNSKEALRSRVVNEIVDTEKKYCSCLWTMMDHFAAPLHDGSILPLKDALAMFPSSLGNLYDQHCGFLQQLETRLVNWKYQCMLGDILSRFFLDQQGELFVHYQNYVNEFPSCLHTIKKCCKSSVKLRKYLRVRQRAQVCEGLELNSFMLTPIQRIPRYVLLLKQLLKYTEESHPDYYPIERCMSTLGHFLTQLNDSIEYSMSIANDDETPKQKRKFFRIPSFRSASMSLSSYEAQHYKAAVQRSGSFATASDICPPTPRGRMFQKDANKKGGPVQYNGSNRHMYSDQSDFSVSQNSFSVSTPYHNEYSAQNYAATEVQSQTLPVRGGRRRPRQRRPKSSDISSNGSGMNRSYDCGQQSIDAINEAYGLENRPNPRAAKLRPKSHMDQQLSDSSFRSQQSGELEVPQHMRAILGDVSKDYAQNAYVDSHVGSRNAVAMNGHMLSQNIIVQNQNENAVVKYNKGQQHHKSLPKISHSNSNDFGIYGDSDEDENRTNSQYLPQLNEDDVPSDLLHQLQVNQRSISHHENLHRQSHLSPSQREINMSLAKSLTMDQINTSAASMNANNNPNTSTLKNHPDQSLNRSGYKPNRSLQDAWNETTMDQSMDPNASSMIDLTLNDTQLGGGKNRRKELKKKKKEKQQKQNETLSSNVLDVSKKKASLRDSLKNLFFRKRGSKVIEIGPSGEYAEVPMNDSVAANQQSAQEQTPPSDNMLIIPNACLNQPEMNTYSDENGDPCSAV